MEVSNISNKRERSPNFSPSEKAILIQIVADKYAQILENKKTDHISLNDKMKTWKNIELEFNSLSPNTYHRSWEVLKRFYENQKKTVRQMKAKETSEKFKTGGGPEVIIKKDSADELLLSVMNRKGVEGLGNTRDSNQMPSVPIMQPMNSSDTDILIYEFGDDIQEEVIINLLLLFSQAHNIRTYYITQTTQNEM